MKEIIDLANLLIAKEDEAVKVMDLPKNLATPVVLAKALGDGVIEVGRPVYSTTSKIKDVVYGKEIGEVSITRETKLKVNTGFSWTDLKGKNSVKLPKLLAEDAAMDLDTRKKIGLCVRMTTEGASKLTQPASVLVG